MRENRSREENVIIAKMITVRDLIFGQVENVRIFPIDDELPMRR